MSIAHKIGEKTRTGDVLISEEIDFSSLLLSELVIQGLHNCGFERPSPIQLKAIPLGRCGLDVCRVHVKSSEMVRCNRALENFENLHSTNIDLIVQAKSGTGKTCVFAVVSLESIQVQSSAIQVLVLAPTREIAIQIWEVIKSIGGAMPALRCHTFIGGLPLSEDKLKLKKCQIAVGSPGRIKQLIETGLMKTDSIRLFVLDEADKLLEDSFQDQINWIYSALPDNKQMLALSATYPESLAQHLTRYMRNPTFMRLNITDPALLGIRQFYKSVPYSPMANLAFEAKTKAVIDLLSGVSFQQCLVFSNLQTRAQNLSDELQSRGWPTACIAGSHDQKDRIEAMSKLKTYKCRVLISTDLTSRGIDADKVNLVINLDVPQDHETYLHRIGRAGRFGSFGAAVTVVSCGQEELELRAVERKCNTHIKTLPDPLPMDLLKTVVPVKLDDVVSTEQLITRPDTESCDQQVAKQTDPLGIKDVHDKVKKENDGVAEESELENICISNGHVQNTGKCEQTATNGVFQDTVVETENCHIPVVEESLQMVAKETKQLSCHDDKNTDSETLNKQLENDAKPYTISEHIPSDTQVCIQSSATDHASALCHTVHKEEFSVKDSSKSEAEPVETDSSRKRDIKELSAEVGRTTHSEQDVVTNSQVNTAGKRLIAKARRKRKFGNDKEKDVNVDCSSVNEALPSSIEIRSSSHPRSQNSSSHPRSEYSSIQSVLSSRSRDQHQIPEKSKVTCPSLRERLGCEKLHKPHSYTSALVDYERFLEEGETVEGFTDIGDLIKCKMDRERKTSSDNGMFAQQMKECIDRVYSCALSEGTRRTSGDVPDSVPETSVQQVSQPCVQKCSKSTQTSTTFPRPNNRPKFVRYHPMSVSSLAFVDSGTVADEDVNKDPQSKVETDYVVGDEANGLDVNSLEIKTESDFVDGETLTNYNDNIPSSFSKKLSVMVHENGEQDKTKACQSVNKVTAHSLEETLSTEITRHDGELVYVSDCVGKISLTAEAVTVEPELLKTISSRPKSRKGKVTADLDGQEFGRLRGQQTIKREGAKYCDMNGIKNELVPSSEELETSDSVSDSSSSSSDYEREVFCNNYVDEAAQTNQRLYPTSRSAGQINKKKSREQRDIYSGDTFENNYFHDSYPSNDYQYDQQNNNQDYLPYDEDYNYSYHNPGEADVSNQTAWHSRRPPQEYYPPYNYLHPSQYYPNLYWQEWYPPQYYPYPHPFPQGYYSPYAYWGSAETGWGQAGRSDEERIEAMKRNMELQRKYIRKMAKRK